MINSLIAVLSAGLKKNKDGFWRSTDIDEKDKQWGAPGGYLRILAASYLYKNNFNEKIIVCGGKGWEIKKRDNPLLCKIMKSELVSLEVLKKDIIEDKISNKTFEQLKELQKLIKKEKINKLILISNKYHLPRIKAMIKYSNELKELEGFFKLKKGKLEAAEDILLKYDLKGWNKKIKLAYESDYMKEIIKKEKKGVEQIKKGTYNY